MKNLANLGFVSTEEVVNLLTATYDYLKVSNEEKLSKMIEDEKTETVISCPVWSLGGTTIADAHMDILLCEDDPKEPRTPWSTKTVVEYSPFGIVLQHLLSEELERLKSDDAQKFVRKNILHVSIAINTFLGMMKDLSIDAFNSMRAFLTCQVNGKQKHTLCELVEYGKQVFDAGMGIGVLQSHNPLFFLTRFDKPMAMEIATFLKNVQLAGAPFLSVMARVSFLQNQQKCAETVTDIYNTHEYNHRVQNVVAKLLGPAPEWNKWQGSKFYVGPGKVMMDRSLPADCFAAKYLTCLGDMLLPGYRTKSAHVPQHPLLYSKVDRQELVTAKEFRAGILQLTDSFNLEADYELGYFLETDSSWYVNYRRVIPDTDLAREPVFCFPTSVPKDFTKNRGITKFGPLAAHHGEKFMSEVVHPRLQSNKWTKEFVNSFDQDVQRELVNHCVERHLATTDYSSASDLLSIRMWKECLPPDWFDIAYTIRPTHYIMETKEPDAVLNKPRRMFSAAPMGGGGTFDLMQVILLAQALVAHWDTLYTPKGLHWLDNDNNPIDLDALLEESVGYFGVVGDDVISPSESIPLFWERCIEQGMIVNTQKSFVVGEIRESCGVFLVDGETHEMHRFSRSFPQEVLQNLKDNIPAAILTSIAASVVALQHELWTRYPTASEYLTKVWCTCLGDKKEPTFSEPYTESTDPWSDTPVGIVSPTSKKFVIVGEAYHPSDSSYLDDTVGWGNVLQDAASRAYHWGTKSQFLSLTYDTPEKKNVPLYKPEQVAVLKEYFDYEFLVNGPRQDFNYFELDTSDEFRLLYGAAHGIVSLPYVVSAANGSILKDPRLAREKLVWDLFAEA